MTAPHRKRRGFTLLEMIVTLAIITVLATLATVGVLYGIGRARASSGVFEASAFLARAKMRGQRTGLYEYAVLFQNGTDSGLELIETKSVYGAADWQGTAAGALPAQQNGNPVTLIDSLSFSTGKLGFTPLSGLLAPAAPFQAVPHTGAGSSPSLLAACSFCTDAAGGGAIGVVRFDPDGTIVMPTATAIGGGTVAFIGQGPHEESPRPRVLAISAPFGAFKVFDGVK